MICVFIRGPASIGKTTVARILASKLNACHVSFDDIMKENHLDTIVGDGIPSENFVKANKIASQMTKHCGIAVLDGCLYRRRQMDDLLVRYTDLIIFNLQAPLSECIKRNNIRNSGMSETGIKEVYNLVTALDVGINIDASGSVESVVSRIQDILEKRFSISA